MEEIQIKGVSPGHASTSKKCATDRKTRPALCVSRSTNFRECNIARRVVGPTSSARYTQLYPLKVVLPGWTQLYPLKVVLPGWTRAPGLTVNVLFSMNILSSHGGGSSLSAQVITAACECTTQRGIDNPKPWLDGGIISPCIFYTASRMRLCVPENTTHIYIVRITIPVLYIFLISRTHTVMTGT